MKTKLKWGLLSLLILLTVVALLWPGKPPTETTQGASASRAGSPTNKEVDFTKFKKEREHRQVKQQLQDEEALEQGLPRGGFEYVFDKAPNANRFLLSKGRDGKSLPDSEAPSGMDLWVQDETGSDRLINDSVYRAKFSPDGTKVAFTTSDCVLHVENVQGGELAKVEGVYGANWKSDGSAVIFAKVGEGLDPHQPGARQLTALDLVTGQSRLLTQGGFDDGRPEFNPADNSILFVSGARTGMASFWKVSAAGGEPVQLTNVGLEQVNEQFVPTPYDRTIWSQDKRWFLYDFKSGDQQETWGLEFNADGSMKRATKLADGVNPRWKDDGKTFVCEKQTDGSIQTIVSNLP